MSMHYIKITAYILVIIGALNWGMVGMFGLDVIARLFGGGHGMRIMYILIGIAAVVMLIL